ncbi:MAG: alkyl hydroperoxide reductase subunit AhpC [Myxococcota bacterium]|jgi:alkyl hydroperoxide reductase subunit AhpC
MSIQVGQQVPDFTLDTYLPETGDFGQVSLEQLKADGKWTVLVFYPADFTFVCATEFAALAEQHDKLKGLGAEVITVSTDTKFVHLAWQREEISLKDAKFAMGADPSGTVSRLFGVYDPASGVDFRGTFVINPQGMLLNAEVNVLNIGRNMVELVRKVEGDIYLAEHGDEACPANWTPGKKTLRPGADLVGRVGQALAD